MSVGDSGRPGRGAARKAALADEELLPVAGGGWTCPRCGRARWVFFGVTPHRRCRLCLWAEQHPVETDELELGRRVADQLARPGPVQTGGAFRYAFPRLRRRAVGSS